MNFVLGFTSAAVVAGLVYVVCISGLWDFIRGKW